MRDIRAGTSGSNPDKLADVSGTLYFRADDGLSGTELWKSNGTSSGTALVRELQPGPNGGLLFNGNWLVQAGGTLYFSGNDGTNGAELWRSDGTSSGTFLVRDLTPEPKLSSTPTPPAPFNGLLYFAATASGIGGELFRTDGTSTGTLLVRDINLDTYSAGPNEFAEVGNNIFFAAASNFVPFRSGLYKTDGTSAGTQLVAEVNIGSPGYIGSSGGTPPRKGYLTNVGGTLFFAGRDDEHGLELWKSNGASTGTQLVKDIFPGPDSDQIDWFTNLNGTLVFRANDGTHGLELWRSDGTSNGTFKIKDYAGPIGYPFPLPLAEVNEILYFWDIDSTYGTEIWRTDGTSSGTYLVRDIIPGPYGALPLLLWFSPSAVVGSAFYFYAETDAAGFELWKSDGTSSGTSLVKDIAPGTSSSESLLPLHWRFFGNVGGTLYFSADDGIHGGELWRSDGTETGTFLVSDIFPGSESSSIQYLTDVSGTAYFMANDGVHGFELWRSDGSSTGTHLVRDINPSVNDPFLAGFGLTNHNGTLFFLANDGATGYELWSSDGTSSGTKLVEDIRPGPDGTTVQYLAGSPPRLHSRGGSLYFNVNDDAHGYELWIIDPPEINIQRAGVNIIDGDTSPSAADGTDFGTATANTSSTYITRQFTIQNTGTGTLNLGSVTTSDPANWSITQQPAATVAPGGSTTFKIKFQPTTGGFLSASVLIPNDDPNEAPYDFAVRGYGIAPGARIERNNLVLLDGSTTPTIDDGSDFTAAGANVSAERVTREFTVKNTGSTPLTLGSVSVTTGTPSAWAVTQQPATSLAPGGSTTFKVRFQPTATGLLSGTVHLPTDDPVYGDYTFDIRGVGTDATFAAEIEIRKGTIVIIDGDASPSSSDGTDFGSVQANNTNARVTRQFTIYNLGVAPLVLKDPLRVAIDSASPADWKVTKLPDGVIQPGGSTTFNVRFQPTSAGLKTATIRILNTDGNESPYDFAIQGLGTSPFASSRVIANDAALSDDLAWLALRAADELLPPRERKK